MSVPSIVGTGLLALDVVFRGNAHEPVLRSAGGTCGNVLAILRYLGWKALPVARLADDRARATLLDDLSRWMVDCRYVSLAPPAPTPIIVERIVSRGTGERSHRFSFTCPCCGAWLPRYRPVTAAVARLVVKDVPRPTVFFFDRPSRGALAMAAEYAATGGLVVFEPSGSAEEGLFAAALRLAHVVKYSDQRFAELPSVDGRATLLEVQTLGARGLRFRRRVRSRLTAWKKIAGFDAGQVVDSAGSGDWCTAGILSQLASGGLPELSSSGDAEIHAALRYGQALGAWNCGFEGARGGMYQRTRKAFVSEIEAILDGGVSTNDLSEGTPAEPTLSEICPACPVSSRQTTRKTGTLASSRAP